MVVMFCFATFYYRNAFSALMDMIVCFFLLYPVKVADCIE